MKNLSLTSILTLITYGSLAQNVGIGIANPAYPLTVASESLGGVYGIKQKFTEASNKTEFYLTTETSGGWLRVRNAALAFSTNGHINDPALQIGYNHNVGIGTAGQTLSHQLDINGRIRIQHGGASNQTAGIWFDSNTMPTRSFLGTMNENHVGFYGSGGAGWNLVMNVDDGNTGIGTSAPSAQLDLNGSLRIRGGSPRIGSELISTNTNGDATWQAPVAFKAWGSSTGSATTYNPNEGTYGYNKYYFSASTDYNLGFHYNTNTSEFTAPFSGIYHFCAQMAFEKENKSDGISIQVYNPANNQAYASISGNSNNDPIDATTGTFGDVVSINSVNVGRDIYVPGGYKVKVLFYCLNDNGAPLNTVSPDLRSTWFAGHLVCRL